MDDYDRGNLNFLLNAAPEVIADWWYKVSEDDHKYAAELLEAHAVEIGVARVLLSDDEHHNLDQAATLLSKFTLH